MKSEKMILKHLNLLELNQLKTGAHVIEGLDFLSEAVPPVHVLDRSSELSDQGVKPIWALPYLMLVGNRVVGCCGFKDQPVKSSVEIGYNVSPIVRGQGLATLAVELLCTVAFSSNSLNTVSVLIASQNIGSLKVVQKNQFIFIEMITDEDGEELEYWTLKVKS
ncbi:MAG: GNAT family N-acetyltransferase [Pseudomonadales bacterium]|nr:GNAT family N-acetyltransferase [Pseudomonadales bacterium]NRA14225.1 GNAT family N-acetyltransferase [Oceanospirillaceae bacterium]